MATETKSQEKANQVNANAAKPKVNVIPALIDYQWSVGLQYVTGKRNDEWGGPYFILPKDIPNGIKFLHQAANADPCYAYELGLMYLNGKDLTQDKNLGLSLLKESLNYSRLPLECRFEAAQLFVEGKRVPKDEKFGEELLRSVGSSRYCDPDLKLKVQRALQSLPKLLETKPQILEKTPQILETKAAAVQTEHNKQIKQTENSASLTIQYQTKVQSPRSSNQLKLSLVDCEHNFQLKEPEFQREDPGTPKLAGFRFKKKDITKIFKNI